MMKLTTKVGLLGCLIIGIFHASEETLNVFFSDNLVVGDECLQFIELIKSSEQSISQTNLKKLEQFFFHLIVAGNCIDLICSRQRRQCFH